MFIIAIVCGAACNAVMDTIAYHYNRMRLPESWAGTDKRLMVTVWGVKVYSNAWHIAKMLMLICMGVAMVTCPNAGKGCIWDITLVCSMLMCWGIVFEICFRLLVKEL
jgi:hypothetical protein